jgi:cytochrome c556
MKNSTLGTFVLITTVAICGASLAHDGATGIVKKRMDAMSDIGKQMKAMASMLKGEQAFDANSVHTSATIIAEHARNIPHLFPEGSMKKPSEALPVVWSRWEDFTKLGSTMEASAASLAEAAETAQSMAGIRDQIIAVGKSCKACHTDFRQAK